MREPGTPERRSVLGILHAPPGIASDDKLRFHEKT
jgi:hypothetical protein